jgi:hypothetical protein
VKLLAADKIRRAWAIAQHASHSVIVVAVARPLADSLARVAGRLVAAFHIRGVIGTVAGLVLAARPRAVCCVNANTLGVANEAVPIQASLSGRHESQQNESDGGSNSEGQLDSCMECCWTPQLATKCAQVNRKRLLH